MWEIEQIDDSLQPDLEYMTTVIALKSENGIVMASDSQSTTPITKSLQVSKIFKITNSIAMGASGKESQIKILREALQEGLKDENFDSEKSLRNKIDTILKNLYRIYNVERSTDLGYKKIILHFSPLAIICAKLSGEKDCFYMYYIYFNETTSWITLVDDDYLAIGSGYPLANLVLLQQSRPFKYNNIKISQLGLEHIILIATIVINEVKAVDTNTGGKTKIVLIFKEGYSEISDDAQQKFYDLMKNKIANGLKTLFDENVDKNLITNMIKNIFPPN